MRNEVQRYIKVAELSHPKRTAFGLARRLCDIISKSNGYLIRNGSGKLVTEGINEIEEELAISDKYRSAQGSKKILEVIGYMRLVATGVTRKEIWHLLATKDNYVPELESLCEDIRIVESEIEIKR